MKKIARRAFCVLLMAVMLLVGLGIFIREEYENGRNWSLYFSAYNSESDGEIIDRNGKMLAYFSGTESTFCPDGATRVANYHLTGDNWNRTGTGLLSRYLDASREYDFITGSTLSTSTVMQLGIDADWNTKAYELLKANGKGAIILCNYRTGEILCMVSTPSVDPLNSDPTAVEEGTYLNRCLSATFTPGSTFKLITSAAAIETIPDLYERTFLCEGKHYVAGVEIKCTSTHGNQTFEEALANSCNCAFAQIAVELGQNTILEYAEKYGFLDSQQADGIPTVAGNFPREFVGDPETAWAGIGQSVDQVCPYAMMRYVSAIANGGTVYEPHFIQSEEPQQTALVSPSTARALQKAMRNNVVTHYEGEVNFPGLNLCAKTGTAELGNGMSHSWFTGFLQDEAHPYAFAAVVEQGGYGLWTSGLMMNELLQYIVN